MDVDNDGKGGDGNGEDVDGGVNGDGGNGGVNGDGGNGGVNGTGGKSDLRPARDLEAAVAELTASLNDIAR